MIAVYVRVERRTDFFFHDMIHAESQRDSCQWACIGRVSGSDGFRGKAGGFTVRRAEKDEQVPGTVLIREFFDPLLISQVHRACGGSDEAFCRREYDLRFRLPQAFLNGFACYAVPVADDQDFLSGKYAHASSSF